ncbi:MFS general substrate transporter [Mollisia scopiformis]|uniref:MFS general substrate transporter n=1 Tax=Mollisia scopiformis TaxID=149040 RepID=A0A132B3S9_MOLSC|nr:MFS general substrate transporter [Mollisia scopiformis]KUJ06981.1 MFS general substrate transporter [Mollisia scopiformis]
MEDNRGINNPSADEKRSDDVQSQANLESLKEDPTKQDNNDDEEPEYIEGIKRLLVVGTVTLAAFLMLLDSSIIVTAIPKITDQFHSVADVGWYGSAFLVASCSLQPLTGKFYTQFVSKYTFMAFLGVFELGSLICGVAQSSNMLIVGRAVAGLGTSGLVNGALTILSAAVPLEIRAMYFGFMMSTIQLGVLLGPLIGGSLTQYTTWRWCFFINLPCGAVVVGILCLIRIPDNTAKTALKGTKLQILHSFDIPGFLLFAPSAIMCLLALQWGGTKYAWNSATIIGLFCGSGVNFILFLLWEGRVGDRAMIPFSMLRQRTVWVSCLFMFFFYSGMMMWAYYLPIYFQTVRDATPTLSGIYMLPLIGTQIFGAMLSGVLISRIGYYLPWAVAAGALTSIASGLMSTFKADTSTAKWVGYMLLGGFGRGIGMQTPLVAVQNSIKKEQTSTAMAILVFTQTFGGSLFLSFADTDLTTNLKDGLKKFAPGVDVEAVLKAGATGFRSVVPAASVEGVILAYDHAINYVFYITIGTSIATFFLAWGMGWKSVKKAKVVKPEA